MASLCKLSTAYLFFAEFEITTVQFGSVVPWSRALGMRGKELLSGLCMLTTEIRLLLVSDTMTVCLLGEKKNNSNKKKSPQTHNRLEGDLVY